MKILAKFWASVDETKKIPSKIPFFKNYITIGEKAYKCEYCEKIFRQSNTLKKHQLIHTGYLF